MIITILAVLLLIAGITLLAIDSYNDVSLGCGLAGVFIGGIMTLVCIGLLLGKQINKEIDYQNALYEKEVLEYRIDNMDNDITGNEMLYNDIVEFNNELRSAKKWANNPFVNWFWNEDIATIDYVEYCG